MVGQETEVEQNDIGKRSRVGRKLKTDERLRRTTRVPTTATTTSLGPAGSGGRKTKRSVYRFQTFCPLLPSPLPPLTVEMFIFFPRVLSCSYSCWTPKPLRFPVRLSPFATERSQDLSCR